MSDLITAKQLRAEGVVICPSVPDCATVPRSSLEFQYKSVGIVNGQLQVGVSVTLTKPFTWVSATIVATNTDEKAE